MTYSADQIVAHAVGDYIIQSDWMANETGKRHLPALLHALSYALPFLFLRPSKRALATIVGTHFLVDRYRLARYLCWGKNQLAPVEDRSMTPTGYPGDRPPWLAYWLLFIADNIVHVLINGLALQKWRR